MRARVNQLDEVIVTETKDTLGNRLPYKPKEFVSVFGKEEIGTKGYSVGYVDGTTLVPSALEGGYTSALVNALTGRIANYKINNSGEVVLRSKNSILLDNTAIWEVDGVIYGSIPPAIPLPTVEEIYVLRGLASTTRYGSLGAGGVIVVRTKNDSSFEVTSSAKENEANTYLGDSKPYKAPKQDSVPEMKYIIENSEIPIEKKLSFLRAQAYRYHAIDNLDKAIQIHRLILSLDSYNPKSYRDLAEVMLDAGKPEKALQMYVANFERNGMDLDRAIDAILYNEMDRIPLSSNMTKKNSIKASNPINDNKGAIRIIFEWADALDDFNLEIVNPDKKVFSKAYQKGPKSNYGIDEFFLDNSILGNWLFNIKPNIMDNHSPLTLKVTIERNWDNLNEMKKEIKLFSFGPDQDDKYLLFNIMI